VQNLVLKQQPQLVASLRKLVLQRSAQPFEEPPELADLAQTLEESLPNANSAATVTTTSTSQRIANDGEGAASGWSENKRASVASALTQSPPKAARSREEFADLCVRHTAALLAEAKVQEGWELVVAATPGKDVRITKKNMANSSVCAFKGEGVVNFPVTEVGDFLMDAGNTPSYDVLTTSSTPVLNIAANTTEIVHMQFEARDCLLKTYRDAVLLVHRSTQGLDTVILGVSVDRPDLCPVNPEVVRSTVHLGGWVLTPINEGRATQATYVVHVDVGGKIPGTIMNVINTRQPLVVHYLNKALKGKRAV
jgi:hypothetical protein